MLLFLCLVIVEFKLETWNSFQVVWNDPIHFKQISSLRQKKNLCLKFFGHPSPGKGCVELICLFFATCSKFVSLKKQKNINKQNFFRQEQKNFFSLNCQLVFLLLFQKQEKVQVSNKKSCFLFCSFFWNVWVFNSIIRNELRDSTEDWRSRSCGLDPFPLFLSLSLSFSSTLSHPLKRTHIKSLS